MSRPPADRPPEDGPEPAPPDFDWQADDLALDQILHALLRDDPEAPHSPEVGHLAGREGLVSTSVWASAEPDTPGAASVRAFREGDRLGPFRIEGELGRGGMGVVYLAIDTRIGRPIALKVPRPDRLHGAALWGRFAREAQLAGGLDHPSIVPVLEAGVLDGIAFIAAAYQRGETLAARIGRHPGGLPPAEAARIGQAVALGLAHAHRRGVLHRDLKPSNILMAVDPDDPEGTPPTPRDHRLRPGRLLRRR